MKTKKGSCVRMSFLRRDFLTRAPSPLIFQDKIIIFMCGCEMGGCEVLISVQGGSTQPCDD